MANHAANKENTPTGDHRDLFLAVELDLNSRLTNPFNCENIERRFLDRINCVCDLCSVLQDQLKICFAKLKQAVTNCIDNTGDYLSPEELLVKTLTNECMQIFSTIIQSSCIEQRDYLGRS